MQRIWALVERDLRRFSKSPALIVMSCIMPIVQLVVLGYAFGGKVKGLKLGVVDQDRGVPAVKLHELSGAVAANARTFDAVPYDDQGSALTALRNGHLSAVLTIPPGYSRRVLAKDDPRIALIEDNTDQFASGALEGSVSGMVQAYDSSATDLPGSRVPPQTSMDVVEVYPYVPYIQYLLSGTTVMAIFVMVMIGGGIIYIDDKSRGLHEGYLVTPISKLELILGFNISGTIKAVIAGFVLITVGSLIAGIPHPFDPLRLVRLAVVVVMTSMALVSMMFMLMARMSDPLIPRAMFGLLNTLLWFPSGAVYPQQAFPTWMKGIAIVDPFTYGVHAFKCLLLKNTGFEAIWGDLVYLAIFTVITLAIATRLFRRTL
ncbi:MAG TPA: ABC transporter permease [Gemmatimonadaceae bacterium]|jgi:ABC-2 type transport system permease protein|nr:ABC transporter permease [Gemmatimonadaceae bacterium]